MLRVSGSIKKADEERRAATRKFAHKALFCESDDVNLLIRYVCFKQELYFYAVKIATYAKIAFF